MSHKLEQNSELCSLVKSDKIKLDELIQDRQEVSDKTNLNDKNSQKNSASYLAYKISTQIPLVSANTSN